MFSDDDKNQKRRESQPRAEMRRRLAKLEREYALAAAEVRSLPAGNGFATQAEMEDSLATVYVSTICNLRRRLGIY